jgi:hypothetical protein
MDTVSCVTLLSDNDGQTNHPTRFPIIVVADVHGLGWLHRAMA